MKLKSLFDKRRNKIILGIVILISALLITITFSLNVSPDGEIKSVEITSKDWDNTNPTPGSWHITKSADWVDSNVAEIKFDVKSEMKLADESKDIILILDTSESMADKKYINEKEQSKIERMKEDAVALAEKVLSKSDNRIALVEFNTGATTLSEFSNDTSAIVNKIKSLGAYGATNYRAALEEANAVLSKENYQQQEGRDLVILFLSDGLPIIETPNQIGEYQALKEKYPQMIAHAVQYEMGSEVVKDLKNISDRQYLAYVDNLRNMLFEASTAIKFYEEFDVTDFIKTQNFNVSSEDNIEVSKGTFEFDKETQKVIWHLGSYNASEYFGTYMSGSEATMTIRAELLDSKKNTIGLFDTNEKESIVYNLYNESSRTVDSTKTPKLYNGYTVYYDTNPPTGCTIQADEDEVHSVLDIVKIKDEDLVCEGYQFKGWQIIEEDEKYLSTEEYEKDKKYKINDTSFRMPARSIHIMGTWTKLDISKSMTGKIYEVKKVSLKDRITENGIDSTLGRIPIDNEASKYVTASTGIDFAKASGETNGKGLYIRAGSENDPNPIYYYRGAVTNNNVLFAGFCWKIVRTTETGGIKLVYNGEPTNNQCITSENSRGIDNDAKYFSESAHSPAYLGYMYGKVYNYSSKIVNNTEYILGNYKVSTDTKYYFTKTPPTWDGSKYILSDVLDSNGEISFLDIWENVGDKVANGGYYTCLTATVGGNCRTLYYISSSYNNHLNYIRLSSGNFVEEYIDETMNLGLGIKDNKDGTYTLTGTTTVKKTEWFNNYSKYKNYYICSDYTKIECDSLSMRFITYTRHNTYDYTIARKIVFGNDVEYDPNTKLYNLKDTKIKETNSSWNGYNLDKYHYTCLNEEISCSKVYYIFSFYYSSYTGSEYGHDTIQYVSLEGASNIDEALTEMFSNFNDSKIKVEIDNWYKDNIEGKSYSNSIENAVWCNDRSIGNYGSWNKDTSNNTYNNGLAFGAYAKRDLYKTYYDNSNRLPNPALKDELACPNITDRFTINDNVTGKGNGNGDLTYPIGLLTADEITTAGNGYFGYTKETYLFENNDFSFWSISPSTFSHTNGDGFAAYNGRVNGGGDIGYDKYGARVAISLKSDIQVLETGDGTSSNPYRIE